MGTLQRNGKQGGYIRVSPRPDTNRASSVVVTVVLIHVSQITCLHGN